MEEFEAVKKYYVHDFKAVQDWFGNRGICIVPDDLLEWCFDGELLCVHPSESAPDELLECEDDGDVFTCFFDSDCFEINDVMDLEESPFKRRIK